MIRVLLADDQPLVRGGLKGILEREPDVQVVGEASTGVEAIAAARSTRPDVVLMDIRMPVLDGLAATKRLLEDAESAPRVIILTTFDLDEYIHAGLRAGACGFVLKDTEPAALVRAVRAAAAGDAVLSPSVTRRVIASYVRTPDPARSLPGRLTGREHDVLLAMARGLSNAEIGHDLHLSEGTVKTHVTSILGKLGVRDRLQAVITAYECGVVGPSSS